MIGTASLELESDRHFSFFRTRFWAVAARDIAEPREEAEKPHR